MGDRVAPTIYASLADAHAAKSASDALLAKALEIRMTYRDWTEWDLEHPYIPHPREADTSGLHDKEYPTPHSGSKAKGTYTESAVPFTTETAQANLQGFFDRGKEQPTFQQDADWYQQRHDQIEGLAKTAGVSPYMYTAVLACTSPLCPWESSANHVLMNVNLANKAIAISQANPDMDPRTVVDKLGDHPGMLKSSLTNALTALQSGGDFDKALNGPKVRSFYNNIVDPQGKTDVTMDTWMARALSGNPDLDTDKELKVIGGGTFSKPDQAKYAWSADMIRSIADQQGLLPNQVQAVIWAQVKRESTIKSAA